LCDEFDQGRVSNAGKLPVKYAHKIRDVVRDSRLLPQIDIEAVLKLLPAATPQK
jgi:hypothetical protein